MSAREDAMKNTRQIARAKQRKAGDRSTRLANALMKLPAPAVKKLEVEDDLREAIERARAVTALIARRRAERTLAGDLRRFDLVALAAKLARVHEASNIDTQVLHRAEQWRARLIEEGGTAAAAFPGGASAELMRLIAAAQRERDSGRPPGAARALFRHVVEELKAASAAEGDGSKATESAGSDDEDAGDNEDAGDDEDAGDNEGDADKDDESDADKDDVSDADRHDVSDADKDDVSDADKDDVSDADRHDNSDAAKDDVSDADKTT